MKVKIVSIRMTEAGYETVKKIAEEERLTVSAYIRRIILDIKPCKKCKAEKSLLDFSIHPANKDGRFSICLECMVSIRRKYYVEHRDEELMRTKIYTKAHPIYAERSKELMRVKRNENREEYNLNSRKWMASKELFGTGKDLTDEQKKLLAALRLFKLMNAGRVSRDQGKTLYNKLQTELDETSEIIFSKKIIGKHNG